MQFFNSGKIFHKKVGQGGGIFQKKYLPLYRNFRNKIYLYEIQNCLFNCAACFDELLCDTLWLLNNITNVNVFKKAEQKKKKKVRCYFLFNKHLKFYYND